MAELAVVAVPYITCDRHLYLAQQTIASIQASQALDLIAVVNKYRPQRGDLDWFKHAFAVFEINDRNNVARAWNRGIQLAFERGAQFALVINLDILFHSRCIDNLLELARSRPEALLWSASRWPDVTTLEEAPLKERIVEEADCSCFMADERLFKEIGLFDEQFDPAYHEDSDMLYRIKLARGMVLRSEKSLFYHLGRGTIVGLVMGKDMEALKALDVQVDANLERYKEKWGGGPCREVYRTPYNK